MEMIEKVERLRERANVTYEEARAALEMTGGDLLDAIVLLEKQGKLKEPAHSTFSTEYEEQKRRPISDAPSESCSEASSTSLKRRPLL